MKPRVHWLQHISRSFLFLSPPHSAFAATADRCAWTHLFPRAHRRQGWDPPRSQNRPLSLQPCAAASAGLSGPQSTSGSVARAQRRGIQCCDPAAVRGQVPRSRRPWGAGVVGGRPGKQGQEGQGCFSSGKGSAGHRSATWPTAQSPPEHLPSPRSPASPSPEAATALRASSAPHRAPAPSTVTFRCGVCTRCCNSATDLVA